MTNDFKEQLLSYLTGTIQTETPPLEPTHYIEKETLDAIKTYFRGVRTEWGKVNWPERRQVVFETCAVIVIVFVFTVAIYLMDLIFKGLLALITGGLK